MLIESLKLDTRIELFTPSINQQHKQICAQNSYSNALLESTCFYLTKILFELQVSIRYSSQLELTTLVECCTRGESN